MMRRLMVLGTSTILLLGATELLAHERFRFVGTITRRTDAAIEMKTEENKKIITVTIALGKKTIITRDKKKVSATAIKVGSSVVVDALGDDYDDMVAEEVRLVPAIPAPPAKQTPRVPR